MIYFVGFVEFILHVASTVDIGDVDATFGTGAGIDAIFERCSRHGAHIATSVIGAAFDGEGSTSRALEYKAIAFVIHAA